jgi:hypothetical protein
VDDLFLYPHDEGEDLILADFDFLIIRAPTGAGRRKPPMAGVPAIVARRRTPEEEEQLRLLRLLKAANDAKSLKAWQEAENEAARKRRNELVVDRLRRETAIKIARGQPNVRKANREIEERERKRIHEQRLANLEKARAKRSGRS